MTKIRVGILFGGKSAEHEVSVRSARNVYEALDTSRFEPVLIGIEKSGRWIAADTHRFLEGPADSTDRHVEGSGDDTVMLQPESKGALEPTRGGHMDIDVVFPILHGPFGEDGTVQGLLKLADLPFVGADVLGSAVGMDKDVMKRLMRDSGIPVGRYELIRRGRSFDADRLVAELGVPLFVKPANLGSSVGVSKVADADRLRIAIDEALRYDNKVLVESAIVGREVECGVLGNEDPQASVVGEIIPSADFYSYAAKYINADGATVRIPADLDETVTERVRELAIRTFEALECEGLSRVDMFVTEKNEVIVNEINTMPGFTSISMYPKLWEASGVGYTELITRLIELAIARHERDAKLKTSYE